MQNGVFRAILYGMFDNRPQTIKQPTPGKVVLPNHDDVKYAAPLVSRDFNLWAIIIMLFPSTRMRAYGRREKVKAAAGRQTTKKKKNGTKYMYKKGHNFLYRLKERLKQDGAITTAVTVPIHFGERQNNFLINLFMRCRIHTITPSYNHIFGLHYTLLVHTRSLSYFALAIPIDL